MQTIQVTDKDGHDKIKIDLNNHGRRDQVQYVELNIIYLQADEQLSERRRTLYKMHRNDGLTYRQIAEKLNLSAKTVENQISYALKDLKKALGQHTLLVVLFFLPCLSSFPLTFLFLRLMPYWR